MFGAVAFGLAAFVGSPPDTSYAHEFGEPVAVVDTSTHNAFGGFVILPNGNKLIAYRSATSHTGTGGVIVQRILSPSGALVSGPTSILSTSGVDYRGATLELLANGDVFLVAERRLNAGGGTDDPEGGVVMTSPDDGASWGTPVLVDTEFTDWGRCVGPVVETPGGDLLMTTYGMDSGDAQTSTRVMTSGDAGATWTTLADIATGGVAVTEAWNEAGMFYRSDGTLVAVVRQGVNGHIDMAESPDDGATWGAVSRVVTNAAGHPQPVRSGDEVVLLYRDIERTGDPARVLYSPDEGVTFIRQNVLDPSSVGGLMTYGQPRFDDNGVLWLVYGYETSGTNSDIYMTSDAPAPLAPTLFVTPGDDWAQLTLTAFEPDPSFPEDAHQQTRWLITEAADLSFSSPVVDVESTTALLDYLADGTLDPETDYIARADVYGVGGSTSSNVVEFTTLEAVTKGDTPTPLVLVEKGQDFIEVEVPAYNHVDGEVEPSVYVDDPTHPVLSLSEIQIELQSDGDWNDPLETVSVTYLETTESRRYRFEDLTAGTAYKFRGRQLDGHLSVYTLYSSDLNVTTDAAPVNAPAQPTIGVSCGRTIVITGSAFSHGMGGTHAGTRVRLCYGSSCKTLNYSTAVTVVTLTDMPPGSVTLALAYQDNAGAWGPYSATSPCAVPDRPPVVVFLTPALGAVVSVNTNVTWEVYDPNAVGWTFDIELSDDGDTFTTVATDQVAASTTFSIVGKANGIYYLRVRARNPTTDETGEWATLPIELDRTGVRAFHVHFADYDSNEEMADDGWVQIWDGPSLLSFALRDQFDPEDEETYRIGLEAKRVQAGSRIRRAGFVNTAWGQPDEFDLTVAFEHIPGGCDWYPYRFQNPEPTRAGSMLWGTHEGSERTGRLSVMRWQDGWFLGPDMQCVSDSFRNFAAATSARHANLPGNTTESFQYARSMTPGRFFQITDREGTGVVVTSASVAMTSTTEDRIGGPNFYWDEDNILGRNRQLFVMRQEVRRAVSGGNVGWNITTRIFGPGATLSSTTAFLREFDDSGNRVICGACGIGFEDMDEQGVGRSDSVIFTDVSLRVHSYGACIAPPEIGCQADWRLTTFKADDVTAQYGLYEGDYLTGSVLEGCYHDNRNCLRPYLLPHRDFSETTIDFPSGSSDIGQIRVGVVDKRITPDQNTGLLTALRDEFIGRRCLYERWREDLGYVTVMDGVCDTIELDESAAAFWLLIRDPRERERKVEMFRRNETFSVYPEVGPVEAYGIFPDPTAGYLIAPVAYDDSQEFQRLTDVDGDQGVHYGYVRLSQVSEEHLERWTVPIGFGTLDAVATNLRVFPDVTIRWRPLAGSTWTYLRNMPAPLNPAFGSILAGTLIQDHVLMATTILDEPALYFGSLTSGDIPTNGQGIEFQILAARTTETTPYMWDRGTVGNALLAAYQGEFSEVIPRQRYNEDRVTEWAEETQRIRWIERAPAPDLRDWVEKNLYAAFEHAPSFDEKMRTIPLPWELPSADEELVELDGDWLIPVGEFIEETESVVNRVKYTYTVESVLPDDSTLLSRTVLGQDQLSSYERLLETKVTRESIFGDPEDPESSISMFGPKEVNYEPVTVRGFGGLYNALGVSLAGGQAPEQIAQRITENLFARFGWGAAELSIGIRSGMAHGPGFDPYTLDLRVGQWVKVRASWLPNYLTGERSTYRYMQITSLADPEINYRRLKLIDGGPVVEESLTGDSDDPNVLPFLEPPTFDYLSETVDLRVEITVVFPADVPAGYKARVDYAVSDTEPSVNSGLWIPLGYLSTEGTILTPVLPAGSTVWVRVRGEVAGRRPSAWSPAESVVLSDLPALLSVGLSLIEGGLVGLEFVPNDFAGGVEIEVSTGTIGHTPAFGAFDEVDADPSDSPVNLLGEEIGYGEELYARVTAWETFSLGAVGGVEGVQYILKVKRENPAETATHEWGAHSDVRFGEPENRTDQTAGLWDTYEQKWVEKEVPQLPIDINTDTTGTLDPNRGGTGLTDADLSGDVGKVIVVNGTADGFIFEDHYTKTETDAAIAALLPIDLTTDVTGELPAANAGVVSGGTTGQVLKKQSNTDFDYDWDTDSTGSGGYSEGTGFPGSPSTNDKFYRTDRNILYYYDGTQWLSVNHFVLGIGPGSTLTATAVVTAVNPWHGVYDIYVEDMVTLSVSSTTTATNYFTHQLSKLTGASPTNVGSASTGQSTTQNDFVGITQAIDAVVTSSHTGLRITYTETGTSSTFLQSHVIYRLVG